MSHRVRIVSSLFGAVALVASGMAVVLAASPGGSHDLRATHGRTFNGRVNVNGILRVSKNESVYGVFYAHGGEQVWHGLIVHNGGIKADSLDVAGPLNVQQNTILSGSLQAGATTVGSSLQVNGSANVAGTLSLSGKVTSNGLDAGSGGVTTTGNISTAAGLSAASITSSGTISGTNVTSGGAVTAGSATLGGLTVDGPVNFSGAQITGLNLSSLNLTSGGVPSLTLGSSSATTSPLTLTENNHSATLGVDTSGAVSVSNLAVTGALTLAGNGLVTSNISAPSGSSTTGGTLSLQSNTSLANGSDLLLSPATNTIGGGGASHIIANGDFDVAGQITVSVPASSTTEVTKSQTFAEPYATLPIVTITAAGDPEPGVNQSPKVWVKVVGSSGNYTGFELHFQPVSSPTANYSVTYDYQVLGQ